MPKHFTFDMCNKNIKLNHIDLAIGSKIVKKNSKGTIKWCDGDCIDIDWLVDDNVLRTHMPDSQFDILYDKDIIEIIEFELPADKPLYTIGTLVKDNIGIFQGIIQEFEYNIIEKQFEYTILCISGDLQCKFDTETILETNIAVLDKLEEEVYFDGMEYKITLEKSEK